MEKRRIEAEFLDKGFGFPVRLLKVPMVNVRGTWTPDINYKELAKTVLFMLAAKPARLSGAEIKFIRTYFEMTLKEFAARFDVSHPAVLKWEDAKAKSTTMNLGTEKDIRLFILSKLGKEQLIVKIYKQLENPLTAKAAPIDVDVEKMAA